MNNVNRPALRLTTIAVMSAIAFMLTFLQIPLFTQFLKFEMSELPVIVLGIILGPLEAVLSELIKNILGMLLHPDGTNGLGNVANFLITSAYILPLVFIYRARDSAGRFILACSVGVVVTTVFACIANYFVLVPLYANLFMHGVPLDEALIAFNTAKDGTQFNPSVIDMRSLILFAVAPFNVVKSATCSIAGYFVVIAIKPSLKRLRLWPN